MGLKLRQLKAYFLWNNTYKIVILNIRIFLKAANGKILLKSQILETSDMVNRCYKYILSVKK